LHVAYLKRLHAEHKWLLLRYSPAYPTGALMSAGQKLNQLDRVQHITDIGW
jgi:hypothetical protein